MPQDRSAYVTGGTGFVGMTLVRLLRQQGVETTCLIRRRRQELERLGVRQVEGDVTDRSSLQRTIPGHTWVFHLAGQVGFGQGPREQEEMSRLNVLGTRHVLEEAWRAGAEKIVVCGSVGALGSSGPAERVGDEQQRHDGRFQSHYMRTKYEARLIARELAAAGAPVVIGHPGPAYGPGGISVVGGQLRMLLKGRMRMIPRATGIHCYTHVEDVAHGLYLLAEKGRVGEEYMLVGTPTTLESFYRVAASIAGVPPPRRRIPPRVLRGLSWLYDTLPGMRRLMGSLPLNREQVAVVLDANWAFSAEKARTELGWSARPLEQGLPETIAWLREYDRKTQGPAEHWLPGGKGLARDHASPA